MMSQTELTEETFQALATFVCKGYSPRGVNISSVPELRWHLFCKHMAENDKMPPTLGALKEHVLRARLQSYIWGQASRSLQHNLDPLTNGYHVESNGHIVPTTTTMEPAPNEVIEMVSCGCKKNCNSKRCSCRSNELSCTDLCQCNEECQNNIDLNSTNNNENGQNDIDDIEEEIN